MEILEMMKEYIKAEFLILIPVLVIIGYLIKNSKKMKNEDIPLLLAVIGMALCVLYIFATEPIVGWQSIMLMFFTAIVQGILVAGTAVFVDQVKKQSEYKKAAEETEEI